VWKEWEEKFGRAYHPVESYRADDAQILINLAGAFPDPGELPSTKDAGRGSQQRAWNGAQPTVEPYPFGHCAPVKTRPEPSPWLTGPFHFGRAGRPHSRQSCELPVPLAEKPDCYVFHRRAGGATLTVDDFRTIVEETEKVLKSGYTDEYKMIGRE